MSECKTVVASWGCGMKALRRRTALESAIALLAGLAGIVTIFWRDWIEAPDGLGSGPEQRQRRVARCRGSTGHCGRDGDGSPQALEAPASSIRLNQRDIRANV
jgi:hypothetical protein